MELAAVGIAHVGLDGQFLDVNPALCELLGYTRDELLQQRVYDVSMPDDVTVTDDVRAKLHSGELSSFQKEKRYIRKDGSVVWVDLKIGVRRDRRGRVLYDVSVVEDITARKRAELALCESESRFKQLTALSSDWYWETDADGTLRQIEGASDARLARRLVGRHFDEIGLDPLPDSFSIRELLVREERFREQLFTLRGVEPSRYVALSAEPVTDEDGLFRGFRGVARDITHRMEAEHQIRFLATHDSLTHLPNRALFTELLDHEVATSRRHRRPIAVAFVDLDRFKDVNDSLGHSAGDELLCEVAARLRSTVGESDIVARLGGDEFVILLQGWKTDTDLQSLAAEILDTVLEPVHLGKHVCRVSCSIGIARFPDDGDDAEDLMRHADLAMYAAKEAGRNRVEFFSHGIRSRSQERFAVEHRLRHALDLHELSLHYQAKLDLAAGTITGVEALLRWQSAELGSIPPAQFIPVAEETGLIVPIGRWVIREACEQNVRWLSEGLPPLCVSVNLSPRQFSDPNLVIDVRSILADTGLPAELLELEITEGAVMPDPRRAVETLSCIKELGVRVAIDDFGTGYSSLAQLRRFPLDTLKIDRSFIHELPENLEDRAITETIIAMGKTLSLTVVAEGVETQDQLSFLSNHACDAIQGFHVSRPLTPDRFAEFVREQVIDPAVTTPA